MGKKFWLKMNEHFYEDDQILFLKSQKNGYEYIYLWQRLLLKSLKSSDMDQCGFLRFTEKIPYSPELMSEIFKMNIDTVRVGIELFVQLGMMEILQDGTIYIEEVQKLIGKESESKERVRLFRERKKALQVTDGNVTGNSNIEKSKIEIKNNKEIDKEIYRITELFFNDLMTIINPTRYNTNKPDLQEWSEHIRLLHERDGVEYKDMPSIWRWAFNDKFWRANILSTEKFRKQFDKLKIQMGGSNKSEEDIPEWINDHCRPSKSL